MAATTTVRSEPMAVELGLELRAMKSEPRQLKLAGSARLTTAMGTIECTTRLVESTRVPTVATSRATPTVTTER